jgi:hypothetical protein
VTELVRELLPELRIREADGESIVADHELHEQAPLVRKGHLVAQVVRERAADLIRVGGPVRDEVESAHLKLGTTDRPLKLALVFVCR